jgi:hypothetical protein
VPVSRGNWVDCLESDQVDIVLPEFGPGPEQSVPAEFALPYRRGRGGPHCPGGEEGQRRVAAPAQRCDKPPR